MNFQYAMLCESFARSLGPMGMWCWATYPKFKDQLVLQWRCADHRGIVSMTITGDLDVDRMTCLAEAQKQLKGAFVG